MRKETSRQSRSNELEYLGSNFILLVVGNIFEQQLEKHHQRLARGPLQTLQINVGKKCNQACRHCHVDAAPWRTEMMNHEVAVKVVRWMESHGPETVDITGGAPELNLEFRYLVEAARKTGAKVIDRNNLTILTETGFEWLPDFLAYHEVEVIASLPCYQSENVRKQRGDGVFERSIIGLRMLNAAGYGDRLPLHLVYNPVGAKLPPAQAELEQDYREALSRDYGIVFSRLLTIANQPIARFAEDLQKQGLWDEYMRLLVSSFNPDTIDSLMCRNTLSVDHLGAVYDCDFNQMLNLQLVGARPLYLWDVTPEMLEERKIMTGPHCLACTAGCGSSCTGALAA